MKLKVIHGYISSGEDIEKQFNEFMSAVEGRTVLDIKQVCDNNGQFCITIYYYDAPLAEKIDKAEPAEPQAEKPVETADMSPLNEAGNGEPAQ